MPIVLSKDEWSRIVRWTSDHEDPEAVRRREYVRYLDETSNAMTKYWPNSVENVNKRNEELRRSRIEAAEKANSHFYKRYLKRKKEEQERMMYSARDIVFKNKDAPKLLLSAVIETCIQKERDEQLKFLGELRRQATEQKRKDDDEIIRKAKDWSALLAHKKKSRFDVNKVHQKEILDQAHEISERNRMEYEEELRMQQLDNVQANQQIKALKEFEDKFKEEEKARIWADMDQARRENEARRAEQAARERMDDRLLEVLQRSRARVERQRKQTEIDVKAERQRVLDTISAKLASGDAAREAKEQAILDKAIGEKDAKDAAKREAQAKRAAAIRRERDETRAAWLRDEEKRLREKENELHFECMNRFKNLELFDDFKKKLRQETERKIKEFRADTLRLWKERDDREARELAETRYFYGTLAEQKLRDADNKLLTHAALLLEEAAANGRPDHALRQAIDGYCKMYRLYPMPDLPASLAAHFPRYRPRDTSAPEAHYRTPVAPRPAGDPDAPDEDDEPAAGPSAEPSAGPSAEPSAGPSAGRNGLNDPASISKAVKKNEVEESVEDYKRVGRADGLQRRREAMDLTLPPITVIPCKTESCRCELKK